MCEIDVKFIPDRRQSPIGGIKHVICRHIVRRSYPFAFEYAPQCFRNVQMRGIWGQEEKEQSLRMLTALETLETVLNSSNNNAMPP